MLLHGIGNVARPEPEVVATEVSYEAQVLAEDLALQEQLDIHVLPLDTRSGLHLRADRLGVALRRQLSALVNVSSGT